MKILSPQTTGDDPLHAGNGRFHLMFFSGPQVSGRFTAVAVVPSPLGPRQPGQSEPGVAAASVPASRKAQPPDRRKG